MKILQLVPESVPTFRADVATLFGKYLPRNGIHCDLVGKGTAAPADGQGFASVRRSRFDGGRLRRELAFAWLCLRALLSANKRNCDLVQVRDMVSIGVLAMAIAALKGLPFCYWVSYLMCEARIERASADLAARPSVRNRLVLLKGKVEYALLYRVLLPRARHVFVQSEAMLQSMVAHGVDAAKMTSVPMGVDIEVATAGVTGVRPAGWETPPLLAYLGTLDPSRNLALVVDALQLVRASMPSTCLLLIGAAPRPADLAHLEQHLAARGMSAAVRITGWLPSAQAWALLAGADGAISYFPRGPILDTCSPTKLQEYLALGIPCVGNDNPDQAAILRASDAGWLVTSDDPQHLAQAMLAMLADLPAARQRAARGTDYIRQHRSYAALAAMVAASYRRLLAA